MSCDSPFGNFDFCGGGGGYMYKGVVHASEL